MIKQLCYYDHPILRRKADTVVDFGQPLIDLIADLKDTVVTHKGLGLAAPQIGVSLRVFISSILGEDEENGLIFRSEPLAYINPKLINPGLFSVTANEGCLSIPKLRAPVRRPQSIEVLFQDVKGNHCQESYSGFAARVVMHENDHLNGVLFIDRLDKGNRSKVKRELNLIKKKYAGFY